MMFLPDGRVLICRGTVIIALLNHGMRLDTMKLSFAKKFIALEKSEIPYQKQSSDFYFM